MLDLKLFRWTLLTKILQRALHGKGIWWEIILDKYLRHMSLEEWYIFCGIISKRSSQIWHILLHVRKWLVGNILWSFGRGDRILIWIDYILGMNNSNHLPSCVLDALHLWVFFFLNQAYRHIHNSLSYPSWMDASDLGLSGVTAMFWDQYISDLKMVGLVHMNREDILSWNGSLCCGNVVVSEIYSYISRATHHLSSKCWFMKAWN